MKARSIRRQLMVWVLGALCLSAPALVLMAYLLGLREFNEVLDDSLRQTALLLADRDLEGALGAGPASSAALASADTESELVAIARRTDGTLLYTSDPKMNLRFTATPGASVQPANDALWDVYTVVQSDRVVQVAQPTAVRREGAGEAASQLLAPLLLLIAIMGGLLVVALRRGLKPLAAANEALAQRNAHSLEPLALDGVAIEIQPLVQTLNDLLQRLRAAFEAQRHFVADAAHELRSPVTALQLQAQVLELSHDAHERARASAELSAGIARTRRLIEQLLQLSRASADQSASGVAAFDRVSLDDLARAAVGRWDAEADRRGIDLGAASHATATVDGDAAQLEILLNNLIENALRYTPRGSVVDVIAQCLDGAPALSVIDDGPGLAAAEHARVFDRFYRSPEAIASAESGSGLGLAIVKSIADRHRASVTLHPGARGHGLEVRVVFPAPR
jgi:two-component system, OmpR family, sensor kinase